MKCMLCGKRAGKNLEELYGYRVCKPCEASLGLYKDNTIRKHILGYEKKRQSVPENPSYAQDIDYRLKFIEEDYLRKRLKLLHIQSRIRALSAE